MYFKFYKECEPKYELPKPGFRCPATAFNLNQFFLGSLFNNKYRTKIMKIDQYISFYGSKTNNGHQMEGRGYCIIPPPL
jgi:hypothetical protein